MTHSNKIKSARLKKEAAEKKHEELLSFNPELVALEKEINACIDELQALRNTCPHEDHLAEYGGNTGNYDLYEKYWVRVKCHDCGRYMTFYSDEHPNEYSRDWKTK